jgi:hypothetical protein
MPTLFYIFGLRFYFYSDEHLPIHIHVQNGDGRAKIEISPNIKLIYDKRIKANDIKKAITIANEFSEKIIEKWHEYFDED